MSYFAPCIRRRPDDRPGHPAHPGPLGRARERTLGPGPLRPSPPPPPRAPGAPEASRALSHARLASFFRCEEACLLFAVAGLGGGSVGAGRARRARTTPTVSALGRMDLVACEARGARREATRPDPCNASRPETANKSIPGLDSLGSPSTPLVHDHPRSKLDVSPQP